MRQHHVHYCGWIIQWDDPTDNGFRFWITDYIHLPDDGSINVALHHMDMFPTVIEGIAACEELISSILTDRAALTYQKVSEYHHSRQELALFHTDNNDYIPF